MARPRMTERDNIRSGRISLALPIKTYDGIQTLAQIRRESVNEFVGRIIAELVDRNADVIAQFDEDCRRAAAAINLAAPNLSDSDAQ